MSLKTAYSLFSFDEKVDWSWAFDHISAAGFDGVEMVLGEQGAITPSTSEKELLNIKCKADEINLKIHSLGVWSIWNNNLLSNEADVRKRGLTILESQIRAAAVLEADKTLMVPGFVGCDFIEGSKKIFYTDAWSRAIEAFSKLGELAGEYRIKIGIENVWNKFLLSPLEMKLFIDEINNPWVGVYFDTGNILYTGYPEDWIRILEKRIVGIHLSDYRISQTGLGAFVDLFAGDVDFIQVACALREIGYNDFLTVEMFPNYRQFPEVSCYTSKYAVDRIIKLIQKD